MKPRKGGAEQCNAITLRSGNELEGPRITKEVLKELNLPVDMENEQKFVKDVRKSKS